LLHHAYLQRGYEGVSPIVSDDNESAICLYRSHGYCEVARRPIVKGDDQTPGADWILMQKP
jgi:ribosomal protein S18 acetylase RimI-like enzyme